MAHATRRLTLHTLSAAALGAVLTGCERLQPSAFKASVDITGAEYGRDFDLPDTDGRRRTIGDFRGKVTVVFFGYTYCPDVCPTTMAELAAARRLLGADAARVTAVFITVDPERDAPGVLREYVSTFGADFTGLRGTPDETRATAKHFKAYFAKVPGATPESYTVDHTAGSYVFDAAGRLRLFTRYGAGAEPLAHDLRLLLAQA